MGSNVMDILNYYRQSGIMTEPGEYKPYFEPLPESVKELCEAIQGFHLHIFWAERYGIKLSEERQKEVNFRTIPQMLKRLLELDNSPSGCRPASGEKAGGELPRFYAAADGHAAAEGRAGSGSLWFWDLFSP